MSRIDARTGTSRRAVDGAVTLAGADHERVVGADRVLWVLKELARHADGIDLDEMTRIIGGSKPTVHRALASLRRAGLARLDRPGHYVLGDELLRMAFEHHEARPEHIRVQPVLRTLSQTFGETAHYAVLEGYDVVYRAKVDPPAGAVRLTSTIGGRNPAHATAVGKLLLSSRLHTAREVRAWIGGHRLERRTKNTACSAEALHRQLEQTRARGYGVDDQENELGINCLALPGGATRAGAISVSAVAYRTPLSALVSSVGTMRGILARPTG